MEGNLQENNNVVTKKNNNSKIIIVVLVIALVSALCYICYDKFINKEEPPVPTPTVSPSPVPTDDTKEEYAEWMTYLLNQNITNISYQEGFGSDSPEGTVTLTVDKLKAYFSELMSHNFKLYKEYWGGRGDASDVLSITYTKNGKEYTIDMEGGAQVIPKPSDEEFVEKLESMGYTERKLDGYNPDNPLIVYVFYEANCDVENDDDCFSIDYNKLLK